MTVDLAHRLGYYGSYSAAAAQFAQMRSRKTDRLRHVGQAILSGKKTGRPVDVYCNGWLPKVTNLRHEMKQSEFCLLGYPEADHMRGYDLHPLLPDAIMTLGPTRFFVEMDCGTMDRKKVQARWQKYTDADDAGAFEDVILVVTAPRMQDPAERLEQLFAWSEGIGHIAYFSTLEEVLLEPYGDVWTDIEGTGFSLEKP